jgi:hypothetical protein
MKKIFVAMAAVSTLVFAGHASAQSFVGSSGTVTGALELQQTLTLPCTLNALTINVVSPSVAYTAFPYLPYDFCSGVSAVNSNSDWTITAISSTQIAIYIPHVNAVAGTCGAGTVIATKVANGPPQQFRIDRQSIPGKVGFINWNCWISGDIFVSGVSLT